MHRLTKEQARRIAIRAQLLDARRPADLLGVVEQLTFLQIDPTAAIAPSADLVAWSRLGTAYDPRDLTRALEEDRTLFEHNALIRPMSDVGLYLAGAEEWPPREDQRDGRPAEEVLPAARFVAAESVQPGGTAAERQR